MKNKFKCKRNDDYTTLNLLDYFMIKIIIIYILIMIYIYIHIIL